MVLDFFRYGLRLCVWCLFAFHANIASALSVGDTYYTGTGANGIIYGNSYSQVCDKFLQSHGYSLSLKRLEGSKCAAYSDRYLLTTYLAQKTCLQRDVDDPTHICHAPPPVDCSQYAGQEGYLEFDAFTGGYPAQYYSVDGCRAETTNASCADDLTTGERKCVAYVEYTGEEEQGTEDGQCNTDDGCDTAGEEPKRCYSTSGVYLGTVGGDAQCPFGYTDDLKGEKNCLNPDGTIAYVIGGSKSCPEGTQEESKDSPDKPTDYENSDGSVDTGDGDSDASEGDGEGDGTGDGSGSDGGGQIGGGDSGEGDQEEQCDSSKFGAEGCLNPTEADQERLSDGGMGEYMERLQEVPLIEAVADIRASMPSGSCSSLDISIPGYFSVDTDIHCSLYSDWAGLLEAVFMTGWVLIGIRIILSA